MDELRTLAYPKDPESNAKKNRESKLLDYKKLYEDNMLQFNPYNELILLQDIKIDNAGGGLCHYHGQANADQAPSGLGLAMNQNGDIYEGYFENGAIKKPYDISKNSSKGYTSVFFKTEDGREYEVVLFNSSFYYAKRGSANAEGFKRYGKEQRAEFI